MRTLADQRETLDIIRRLHTVRPDTAARWGRMTAHQMVCHVADSLLMALDERPVRAVRPRTIIRWVALYLPVPWPAGLPTAREIDQEFEGTRPADFVSDVRHVESLLRRITDQQASTCPTHPVFGTMSRAAWLRWGYLHIDHHLRQFGA